MKFILGFVLRISIVFLSITATSQAQIPRTISYQGVLANSDGSFVADGNHSLTLTLYQSVSGGAAIYTEAQTVPVVRGLFNVIIGSVTALPNTLQFDRAYFLGVSVDGTTELSPRTALAAVPYALNAAHAAIADALSAKASGAVTSINEQSGALRILGAGATTVSNVGNTFTISSTSGSGGGFTLPYSGSAANGNSPIFNIINTGSGGNTISGSALGGSKITQMGPSAVFGDAGQGYNGVCGSSNGGSNLYAGVLGQGAGSATGVTAIAAAGDGIDATSTTGHAGHFQITNAASSANAIEATTLGSGEAIRGTAVSTTAIHGLSANGTGVVGETQTFGNSGVEARYSGSGPGIALELNNGAIKIAGATRSVFQHTTTAANIWGPYNQNSEIDNPLCNGDSTAMVFITQSSPTGPNEPTLSNMLSWWHIVYYNTTRQKWQIFTGIGTGIGQGEQFFVMVFKR